MTTQEKLQLISRNTEEVIGLEELEKLLDNNTPIKHYIGFEISGRIHLGSGIGCMQKVKDFMDAGAECSIFLADWHAWLNDKLNGDLKTIGEVAVNYFKEGMRESFRVVGGDPDKLKFVLGSELYHNNDQYWQTFVDISKNLTLSRVKKSITIMGREEGDSAPFAWLVYPPMQVADIFIRGLNLVHAGLDQRKAHVIAREVAPKMKISPLKDQTGNVIKPVAIHHHLTLGLGKPSKWPIGSEEELRQMLSELKMTKSKPETCVFIEDSEEDIKRKIMKAFCPEGETGFNPILDWTKSIIFPNIKDKIVIERAEQHGGNLEYATYQDLEKDFADKKIHPTDLKSFVASWLADFLKPVRDHFSQGEPKKMKEELEKIIKNKNK